MRAVTALLTGALLVLTIGIQAAPSAQAVGEGNGGVYVPMTPFRAGSATIGAGAVANYQITGDGRVPAGSSAVVVDIAVTDVTSTGSSHLTAYPTGTTRPAVSTMQYTQATAPRSNTAIVPIGDGGRITVYNRLGSSAVHVDVQGYFTASSDEASPGGFQAVQPFRVARSDTGQGMTQGIIPKNGVRDIQVTGLGDVPESASAVFANVEVSGASAAGNLWVGPGGQTRAGPAGVNYGGPGVFDTGLAIRLSNDGRIRVTNNSTSDIHIKVDVQGFFTKDPDHGGSFHPLSPALVYDTTWTGQTALAGGETREVMLRGMGGIPDEEQVGAVPLIVNVKNWSASGTVRLWSADEASVPATVNVSFSGTAGSPSVGSTSSAIVAVSTAGKIKLRNTSSNSVHVSLVSSGWFDAALKNTAPSVRLSEKDVSPSTAVGSIYRTYADNPVIQPLVVDGDGEDVRLRVRVRSGSTVVSDSWSSFSPQGQRVKVRLNGITGTGTYDVDMWAHDGTAVSEPRSLRLRRGTPSGVVNASVRSATSSAALAGMVTDQRFPSGVKTAVIVPNVDDLLLEGAAVASSIDAALVPVSGAEARLQELGVEQVYFYSTADGIDPGTRSSLLAGRNELGAAVADNPSVRTAAAAIWASTDRAILVSTGAPDSLRGVAASAAAASKIPLLVMNEASEAVPAPDNSAVRELVVDGPVKKIAAVGGLSGLQFFEGDEVGEDGEAKEGGPTNPSVDVNEFEGDVDEISAALAEAVVAEGQSARRVAVGRTSEPSAIALAGFNVAGEGVVLTGAPTADLESLNNSAAVDWVRQFSGEISSLTALGVAMPSNYAASIGLFAEPRAHANGLRVADIGAVGDTTRLSFAGIGNATSLTAYDIEGAEVATSSSSVLTVPGTEPVSLRVVAKNGTATTADIEVRYTSPVDDVEAGTLVSSAGNSHHISWYSHSEAPRLVTRYMLDPLSIDEPVLTDTGHIVGVTCGSSIADATNDQTKQYRYEVTTLAAGGGAGCEASGQSTPHDTPTTVGTVEAPPMDSGSSASLMAQSADTYNEGEGVAARPSVFDALIRTTKDSESGLMRVAGPGDDWLPFLIRYQGFIPKNTVTVPVPTGNLLRPVMKMGADGNDRVPHPRSNRYRFRVDTRFSFGANHGVSTARSFGLSHRYHCRPWGSSCKLAKTGLAPQSDIDIQGVETTRTSGKLRISMNSPIPVLPRFMTPGISAELGYTLRAGSSSIRGFHDRMPSHEIWGGPVPGQFFPIHYTRMKSVRCLFPGVPRCTAIVSARL